MAKTAAKTYTMFQNVYGETGVTNITVFKWFGRFQEENESLEDDGRSGRTSTTYNDVNVIEIKTAIGVNRRLTIREIAKGTNHSVGSVQSIL